MYNLIKKLLLYVFKYMGLFHVSRRMTKQGLRILCYHGFSINHEPQFWPSVFMDPENFRRRMDFLVRKRYPVMELDEALSRMEDDTLPPCTVVLTFDDGFSSIYRFAAPILRRRNLPGTIYVTTYYSKKQNPIFRIVVQYMFWKTMANQLNLTGLGLPRTGSVSIQDKNSREKICWEIIHHGETDLEEDERCHVAEELGNRLEVPYEYIVESRSLSIMNAREITAITADGIDIQLHTHRHCLPEDGPSARREIQDNRSVLEALLGKPLNHLCYPSGLWSKEHFATLAEENIKSAMTCDPGFNYRSTHNFALKRFLDGQHISDIEFEAELCGATEMFRKMRFAVLRLRCLSRRA